MGDDSPPPPPVLDYARRRQSRMWAEHWRAVAADCAVIGGASVIAGLVGFATAFVLHEVFASCFGGR